MKTRKECLIYTLLCMVLVLAACTVTPRNVKDAQPSFDGGQLNSGFLGFTNVYVNNVPGEYGVLSSHAVDRYNALIANYGEKFIPPLKSGDGIFRTAVLSDIWFIDKQHLVYFETMNRWRKEGK